MDNKIRFKFTVTTENREEKDDITIRQIHNVQHSIRQLPFIFKKSIWMREKLLNPNWILYLEKLAIYDIFGIFGKF